MYKLLEIGEIGPLRDIPSELTFITTENKLLKQSIDKLKFEKTLLAWCIFALVFYIIWHEIKNRNKDAVKKRRK
jgi:hypothetical protein